MTEHGTLTDYEGTTARIDDKPIHMWDAAAKFCAKNLRKGMKVSYEIKDTKIVKIYEDTSVDVAGDAVENAKRAAAGFNNPVSNPAPAPSGTCTSPETPAAGGLKVVEGQITAIDHAAHTLTLKDRTGTSHAFVWPAPMNDHMAKLKPWWFAKITAEQSGEYWKVTAQDFFRRPDDWPAGNHGGHSGGRSFQPRNEKLIVLQSTLKVCADVFAITTTPDTVDFDAAMDKIVARAIKDTETLMKAGGA